MLLFEINFLFRRLFRAIDELDSRRAVSSSACTGGAAAPTPRGGLPPPSPFIGTYSARPVLYGSGGRSGGSSARKGPETALRGSWTARTGFAGVVVPAGWFQQLSGPLRASLLQEGGLGHSSVSNPAC